MIESQRMSDEDDDLVEIFCYVCQTSGHEDSNCNTLRCKKCNCLGHIQIDCKSRHFLVSSEPGNDVFITNILHLKCSTVPTKKEIRQLIDSVNPHGGERSKDLRSMEINDSSSEVLVTFTNPESAYRFSESLKLKKPKWFVSYHFIKGSFRLPCRHQGKKYLSAVLSFESIDNGSSGQHIKNCIITSDCVLLSLGNERDFLISLRAFAENKLKKCDSRNEYDVFLLLVPSEKDLRFFFSWIQTQKVYEDLIKVVDYVGYLTLNELNSKNIKPVEQGLDLYSRFQNQIETKGFSQFMNCEQIFLSHKYTSSFSFKVTPNNRDTIGICSLCFKILSNKSTCLLQIGIEIKSLSNNKAFTQQYSISPQGANKEELIYYGYGAEEGSAKFYQKVNCSVYSGKVDVLSEKDAINRLVSDVEEYASSSGINNFFVLVHSNFISLPLFLQALSKVGKLSNFQRFALGVVDLASVVPLGNKGYKRNSSRAVLVPSLDTIFRKLSLPPRDIHDPVVLTAVRMRECLEKVLKNHQDHLPILKDISRPQLVASDTFFCKEILLNSNVILEASKSKWIIIRRKESVTDLCFIPGLGFQFEISEFNWNKENYLFKISNKKNSTVNISSKHQLGYIVSSPWSHLCASHISFLPPSPIPCWVGLQINALWPKCEQSQRPISDSFLTNQFVNISHTWIKPNVQQHDCNIFLISIKTEEKFGTITQVSLLSIDANEERSFVHYYLPSRIFQDDPNYLKHSLFENKYFYKDISYHHLASIDNDFSSLKTNISRCSNLILVGYNIGAILQILIPKIGHLSNIIGVVELSWCLASTYDKLTSWFDLVDFPKDELEECSQMNQVSLATLQKTLKSVSFTYHNLIKSFAIGYDTFYNQHGCKVNLDNASVLKLSDEKITVFVDLEYHEGMQKCLRSIGIKVSSTQKKLFIDQILPLNLSRNELLSSGYSMNINSGSWKYNNTPVIELPQAMAQVLSFFKSLRSWLIIITSNIQIRQFFRDTLMFYEPFGFEVLQKHYICGWCDLISSFYNQNRPSSFVAVQRSSSEVLSVLHDYYFNSIPKGDTLDVIEKIAGSLTPKVEKSIHVPPGNYLTFFMCIKTLKIASNSQTPFINSKTMGLIGCYSVHNSYSSIVPVIPPPSVCPKSAEALHFVKTQSDAWEYGFAKHKDCFSQFRAINFMMQTIDNEIHKANADGALLITLTSEELSYFLASVQNLNFTNKFMKSVVGIGDISSYLKNERHLENVSTLQELHHFYLQNIDSCISTEPNHFFNVSPGILTKYVSFLARYLVSEDFHKLTHTFNSNYFNQLLVESNLIEFREGSCDIVVDKGNTIPAKSKMRVDVKLKGFLFTNGIDEKMIVSSPNIKCPIRVDESTIVFFKSHAISVPIENLDKVQVQLVENITIVGRAIVAQVGISSPSNQESKISLTSKNYRTKGQISSPKRSNYQEEPPESTSSPTKKHKYHQESIVPNEDIRIHVEPVPIRKVVTSEASSSQSDEENTLPPLDDPSREISRLEIPISLPPEEDVRHELQGFDVLCMDSSYEPLLLTLLRLWHFQKKPFNHELGDSLIFRLMSVGLGIENIHKLIKEKKLCSIEDLKNELYAEYIVLQDMLDDLSDLFFEVAEVHFLTCTGVATEQKSPLPSPPTEEISLVTVDSDKEENEEVSPTVLKEGYHSIISSRDLEEKIEDICLVKSLKKAANGLQVVQSTPPYAGRVTNIQWENVYYSNQIGNFEEGIYLRMGHFAPLKLWNSYKDCFIGFIMELRDSDYVIGFLYQGILHKCFLPRTSLLFYESLASPGRSTYLTLKSKNESGDYDGALGLPVVSLSSFTFVAFVEGNEETLGKLKTVFQKGLTLTKASNQNRTEEYFLCKCANQKIYRAVERLILNPNSLLKNCAFEGNLCVRASLEMSTEVELRFNVLSFINRSGTITLIGDEISIANALEYYSKKIFLL